MRQASSSLPSSSVSFFEKYEQMFHCGGCIADKEPVAAIYQPSRYGNEESNNHSNWSSYIRERRQQESAPLDGTVLLNQATSSSYDEIDKFDIDERKPKRQQSKTKAQAKGKAHTEATAVNEYFNGIRNSSHQPKIQMAMQRSPTTIMTQQQQRRQPQQHCHATPLKSNTTSTRKSTCSSSSSPKSTKRLHYDMLKDMVLANNNNYRSSQGNSRYLHSNCLTKTDSNLTQSTQSLSEAEDDISWDPIDEVQQPQEQEQQDTQVVSILRRKVKLGTTDTVTKTKTTAKNRGHVRFEQDTQFPDPNARPSSSRKHVPRMSKRQKQEYQLTKYQPPVRRRQLDLSSLQMAAAASPSLVISTDNNDECCDYSSTNNTMMSHHQDSACRYQKRLARRAHNSSTAAKELLSHYYNQNDDVASFDAFR